ncbi:MAG: phosphoribosylanthranilate isomerase [Schwartzia sp.]|nr:phosphoribosylanthranilate isomerase [Schwartzia sp. (in: firmicutes)]
MKIKICGIRTTEAARTAVEAGADFLGFIFYRKSRRYIEPEEAACIVRAVRSGGALTVGVVVDETAEDVVEMVRRSGVEIVQLHGHEPPEVAAQIRNDCGVRIIKAFRWRNDFSAETANLYPADYYLLDSFRQGVPGGTGETFAWREAAGEARRLAKPLFVAGGISKDNAGEAARIFGPFGLDVSGSLEENGEKSPEKIREFLKKIKTEAVS